MKKSFKYMLAAVAALGALVACNNNEPEEIITPEPEVPQNGSIVVNVKMSDTTRALTDAEGIKWAEGDLLTAWYLDLSGETPAYSYQLKESATISEAGYETSVTLNPTFNKGKLWLTYGSNIDYDQLSARKIEFNYNAAQTQNEAGVANTSYLRLVGKGVEVAEGTTEYTTEMEIVGTAVRFILYSAEGTYAAEQVKNVQLISVDNVLAGGSAAIARNYADYHDTALGYKWWGMGDAITDHSVIYWDGTSKSITTTLATPFALTDVKDAASSKGIYLFVPPVSVGGYKYVVETDVARYTFDASTSPVTFKDNTILNVKLNLEKADDRIELSSIKGDLQYLGDLNAASNIISYEGVTEKDGGYWYAQTRDTGADWVTKEGIENVQFYTGVTFDIIDNATGEEATWLNVYYKDDGSTHWFLDVEPQAEGGAERSATVTAHFPDVDGYYVIEACKTKTVTVTQQAYTTDKILGFYGGIGDQVIDGDVVNKLSMGYCVITVNGVYAEDWDGNSHNEQALYGNVVIECRDGGAAAPIVDWLTVEYGKNDQGKFNSTHLLATATANNTGAERKALVCCYYNAPEGYKFENGSTTFFRQFMVTQSVAGGLKMIEFWGGIASQYEYESQAYVKQGLSYWVIKVAGQDATDWGGDSHNEQALYGAASFKCYDYTNGVRGAEVDWVKVYYKHENGKIIDTWWLADIEENTTGAVRKAEIVCTFADMEGYAYKNDQNVRSTIIIQNPAATTPDVGGGEEEGGNTDTPEGFAASYTIFNNAADGSKGTGFGPGAGSVGDWYRFENITINGKTYTPGDEIKNLAANSELMAQLMAQAFEFGVLTEDDVQVPGVDPLTTNPESFVTLEPWSDGGAAIYVRIILKANDSGARRTFKVITKNGEGVQQSSVVYFQNI